MNNYISQQSKDTNAQNDSRIIIQNNRSSFQQNKHKKQSSFKSSLNKCFQKEVNWKNMAPRVVQTGISDNQNHIQKKRYSFQNKGLYPNNFISTSQYSWISFIPKNIFQQFSQWANLYFLFMGLLQMVPDISNSNGIPAVYLPLSFIVIVTGIKDLYQDYKRKKSDEKQNNFPVHIYHQNIQKQPLDISLPTTNQSEIILESDNKQAVLLDDNAIIDSSNLTSLLNGKGFQSDVSSNIQVGNIICVLQEEIIPADMILIYVCQSNNGVAFIETKNLDGETNLKCQTCVNQISTLLQNQKQVLNNDYILNYEGPNPFLYKFSGSLQIANLNESKQIGNPDEEIKYNSKLIVGVDNFLLRGCKLQNTEYIIGIVCYTGHETKIMLNSNSPRSKRSKVEHLMHQQILVVFFAQMIICLFCGLYYSLWYKSNKTELAYLEISNNDLENQFMYNFILQFGNWVIIFVNFVPISLLLTLEMVRVFQAYLMIKQKQMRSSDGEDAIVQSSNLNEDLGQISFIFSDKTGTLTQNIMFLQKVWVNEKEYSNQQFNVPASPSKQGAGYTKSNPQPSYIEEELLEIEKNEPKYRILQQFMTALGLCHSIIVEKSQNQGSKSEEIIYNSSSPDELALVEFAQASGFQYKGIDQFNNAQIKTPLGEKQYRILVNIQFTSERKQMTVILKKIQKLPLQNQESIIIYSQGADEVMLPLINSKQKDQIQRILKNFSQTGLRTLVVAKKQMPFSQYQTWFAKYQALSLSVEKQKELQMKQIYNEIQNQFQFLGVTAVQDSLQDKVPETIRKIQNTGIGFWILTGDQLQTAINIGLSSRAIEKSEEQIIFDSSEEDEIQRLIESNFVKINENQAVSEIEGSTVRLSNNSIMKDRLTERSVATVSHIQLERNSYFTNRDQDQQYQDDDRLPKQNQLALIITGEILSTVIHKLQPEYARKFFMIAKHLSSSVIICRVSPKQQKEVVQLFVEYFPNQRTLAIGDGANDVSMINQAHIGIGIQGREGAQAVRASDYAIGEFRILQPLLFYHGREFYRKNSMVILYNFYKNIVYLVPIFWFGTFSGFSGTFIYDVYLFQLFNTMYTAIPIIIYAVFDKDLSSSILIQHTYFYKIGIQGRHFSPLIFWQWFFTGALHAFFICMISIFVLENTETVNGYENDVFMDGQVIFASIILVVNFKVLTFHNIQYLMAILINILSFLSYIVTLIIMNKITSYQLYDYFHRIYSQPIVYFTIFLILGFTNLTDLAKIRWQDINYYYNILKALRGKNLKRIQKLKQQTDSQNETPGLPESPNTISRLERPVSPYEQFEVL